MATKEMIGTVASGGNNATTSASSIVGKEDFLKLLVTQLQYQDPLNPMESTEFTAQLAQFSSLEQLTNVNENLEYIQLYQASINNAQAVDFIGKTIKTSGDTVSVTNGVSEDIDFELTSDAASVTVSVYDGSGTLVATIEAGDMTAGKQTVSWNAENQDGDVVADGDYTFEVAAIDAEGNTVEASTFTTATVTGVTFENGTTYLIAGGKKVAMGDVVEILGGSTPQSTNEETES